MPIVLSKDLDTIWEGNYANFYLEEKLSMLEGGGGEESTVDEILNGDIF